jgi:hypothetical protein
MNQSFIIMTVLIIGLLGAVWYFQSKQFPLPTGDTTALFQGEEGVGGETTDTSKQQSAQGQRNSMVTDGVKHSIPLDEILSGGVGKDGIPSIDDPQFVSIDEVTFLDDTSVGIGLTVKGESHFYPYYILVWHEIVNDVVAGQPILVTYCPLCATGIVFDRRIDGEVQEFGVSGRLWQSNLLMYNRAPSEVNESLWSQVLGEAVLGVHTGKKLTVVRSDVVRFGDWKTAHPDTKVLSLDTGEPRDYGRDPYGEYYTNESVSFGAQFNDTRLHPKALVHGIEIGGEYKAYHDDALSGTITDTFVGKQIVISRNTAGELFFEANGAPLPSIPGFWFSWLAVHPGTFLYTTH